MEHIYSFGHDSHASGMVENDAEVISISIHLHISSSLYGDVTEAARLTVCEEQLFSTAEEKREHLKRPLRAHR